MKRFLKFLFIAVGTPLFFFVAMIVMYLLNHAMEQWFGKPPAWLVITIWMYPLFLYIGWAWEKSK